MKGGLKENLIQIAEDYREAMGVEEVLLFPNGNAYAVCPRCKITLEREYQSYCDRCGQHLDWRGFRKARVIRRP